MPSSPSPYTHPQHVVLDVHVAAPATGRLPEPMRWLARTARRQRLCLVLFVGLRMTPHQVAELTGLPVHTVLDLLAAACRELSSAPGPQRLGPPATGSLTRRGAGPPPSYG